MLQSLFGDLMPFGSPRRGGASVGADGAADADAGFAATAILDTPHDAPEGSGPGAERQPAVLDVDGSAAVAMRAHLAETRADLAQAARMITLLDPTQLWSVSVIKALADATGRPIERLQLRERQGGRVLGQIERIVLLRRQDEPLKIYTATLQASGSDIEQLPVALVERSHMAAVIVGPMTVVGVEDLLSRLQAATRAPTWACPCLVFMLPPEGDWIATRVQAVAWPAGLTVLCVEEPLVSASTAWNALLGVWNRVKQTAALRPLPADAHARPPAAVVTRPMRVADLPGEAGDTTYGTTDLVALGADLAHAEAAAAAGAARASSSARIDTPIAAPVDRHRAQQALAALAPLDGLIAAAVVDLRRNAVVAAVSADDRSAFDLEPAVAAISQALRAQKTLARTLGLADRIDETVTAAGTRQWILRGLNRHPDAALVVLLDRQRGNLALARFRVMEAERSIA